VRLAAGQKESEVAVRRDCNHPDEIHTIAVDPAAGNCSRPDELRKVADDPVAGDYNGPAEEHCKVTVQEVRRKETIVQEVRRTGTAVQEELHKETAQNMHQVVRRKATVQEDRVMAVPGDEEEQHHYSDPRPVGEPVDLVLPSLRLHSMNLVHLLCQSVDCCPWVSQTPLASRLPWACHRP
jgi:hypothetical protein